MYICNLDAKFREGISSRFRKNWRTDRQTNKQTERMTDKPTKQKDYTSPALAGAGDYNKPTKLEEYSRHSRQPSLNISHIQIRSLLIL